MKAWRPIRSLVIRRRFRPKHFSGACWGAPDKNADRSNRPDGSAGLARRSRPPRQASHLGPSERDGQRMARHPVGPLGPTIEIAGAALPTQSVPPRGEAQGEEPFPRLSSRRCVPAGPRPQPGPAGLTIHLGGAFDCPRCGWPIGRGHADDCPSRPVRARLGLPVVALAVATPIAGALTLAAVAIALGAGAVLLLAAYQPPARQDGRGQPPLVPAARAGHHP